MKTKHTQGEWQQCCAETMPHFVVAGEDKAICAMRSNDPHSPQYEKHLELSGI